MTRRLLLLAVLLGAATSLPACDRLYYKTMKKFGMEKRDILVKRVRDAREAQQKGKEEFRSALDRFKSVVETPGGALEDKYDKLSKELERSEDRAKEIHDKVESVKGLRQRRLHKAFLRYHDPDNWPLLREALKHMGRADLIGSGPNHLVPTYQPAGTGNTGRPARKDGVRKFTTKGLRVR